MRSQKNFFDTVVTLLVYVDVLPSVFCQRSISGHLRQWKSRISVSYLNRQGVWMDWDANVWHSHAEGYPRIPYTAETAFVSAYNMKFYGSKHSYNSTLHTYHRVISKDFYKRLGI